MTWRRRWTTSKPTIVASRKPSASNEGVALGTALRDFRQIGEYIGRDNFERSVGFAQELRRRMRSLGQWPERFPIMPRFERERYRRCVHGRYAIVYRVETDHVSIIRVFHIAQDYESLLAAKR